MDLSVLKNLHYQMGVMVKITTLIGKNLFGSVVDIGSDAVKKTGMCGLNLNITNFSTDYTFYEYGEDVTYRNSYTRTEQKKGYNI